MWCDGGGEDVSGRGDARILTIRGEKVLLDADLAEIYGVRTSARNQAVKRNRERFPNDFAFRLTPTEYAGLKSQIVISSGGHGGRRQRPWCFTEHGAIVAASVLNSPRAVEMSVFVVRAFVRLRDVVRTRADLAESSMPWNAELRGMMRTCSRSLLRSGGCSNRRRGAGAASDSEASRYESCQFARAAELDTEQCQFELTVRSARPWCQLTLTVDSMSRLPRSSSCAATS